MTPIQMTILSNPGVCKPGSLKVYKSDFYFLRFCAMCFAFVCYPGFDVINFEINLSNHAAFIQEQKIKTKI